MTIIPAMTSSIETPSSSTEPSASLAEEPIHLPNERVLAGRNQWNRIYLLLFAGYIVLGLAVRLAGWVHGDATWLSRRREVLDGSFDLYSFRAAQELIPPDGATYAYSPLTAIILAPFVGLADVLGWGQAGAEWIIALPLLVADVLAMHQLRLLVRAWRPLVDEGYLFSGVVVSLFLTSFLGNSAYYGHNEGLMLLFLLLALRLTPHNWLAGGLCAGLALAVKHTTLLDLLPIGFVLLLGRGGTHSGRSESSEQHRAAPTSLAHLAIWAGAAVGVFMAFMLIPLLRYPDQVYYAFVTQIAKLPLFGAGLPVWVDRGLQSTLSSEGYAAAHVDLLAYANWVLLGVVAFACALVVWQSSRNGQPIGLSESRLLALVGFAAISQIVLGKWVSGHYYQLPLALVFLWDVVRRSNKPVGRRENNSWSLDTFPLDWPWGSSDLSFNNPDRGWVVQGMCFCWSSLRRWRYCCYLGPRGRTNTDHPRVML